MNVIKNIRLKFSNFFSKKQKPSKVSWQITPWTPGKLPDKPIPIKEELDILRRLSGIEAIRKESSLESAYQKLLKEETDKEYNNLLTDQVKLAEIRERAAKDAECKLENSEAALAMANAMEGRNRKIAEEKFSFDDSWSKYSKRHIRKRDPKASDFAKFLVKHDFLEENLLDEIAVTSIFVDNEITNFRDFRTEIKRVNNLN